MDPRQFDAFTRALLAAPSRRRTLAAIFGALLASLVPVLDTQGRRRRRNHHAGHPSPRDDDPIEAGKKTKPKKKCKVKCGARVCGPSNCKGKSCGSCAAGARCTAKGRCECAPRCQDKDCGPDGCGGDCGQCSGASTCNQRGKCVGCLSADDCASGQICTEAQTCCTPNCDGRHCQGDGCGQTCACPNGTTCVNGACKCSGAGEILCGGSCITAECCAPGDRPGILCGGVCLGDALCCPNGQGCGQTDQCCGFDRPNPTDRAICQGDRCCQPLGGICGGQSTTCCQGTCKLGICDACEAGACCTNHAPGCPAGMKCCGTTCIADDACCSNDAPGCGQFQRCCGGVCVGEARCCTNGQVDFCPSSAAICFDGVCVECTFLEDCEFRPCRQTICTGGRCEYPAGHEGEQCLIEQTQQNGLCCGGACSQCCGANANSCPVPPACLVRSCSNNHCVPSPLSESGPDPLGRCTLCCTDGDCCDDAPGTICGDGGSRCCYPSGATPDNINRCCSGTIDALGRCT